MDLAVVPVPKPWHLGEPASTLQHGENAKDCLGTLALAHEVIRLLDERAPRQGRRVRSHYEHWDVAEALDDFGDLASTRHALRGGGRLLAVDDKGDEARCGVDDP